MPFIADHDLTLPFFLKPPVRSVPKAHSLPGEWYQERTLKPGAAVPRIAEGHGSSRFVTRTSEWCAPLARLPSQGAPEARTTPACLPRRRLCPARLGT